MWQKQTAYGEYCAVRASNLMCAPVLPQQTLTMKTLNLIDTHLTPDYH